jgi:uncharacterized iron-regulated membrane protein
MVQAGECLRLTRFGSVQQIIEVLAVLVVGPMVGSEFAVAAFVNPIVGRLPDDAFRTARSDSSRLLGKVMPFWYIASLGLLAAAAVVAHSRLIGIAAGLMAVVVVLTVALMVPINNRIAAWSTNGAPSRELAARWDRLHALRVTLLAALFVLLAAACFG